MSDSLVRKCASAQASRQRLVACLDPLVCSPATSGLPSPTCTMSSREKKTVLLVVTAQPESGPKWDVQKQLRIFWHSFIYIFFSCAMHSQSQCAIMQQHVSLICLSSYWFSCWFLSPPGFDCHTKSEAKFRSTYSMVCLQACVCVCADKLDCVVLYINLHLAVSHRWMLAVSMVPVLEFSACLGRGQSPTSGHILRFLFFLHFF